MAKITTLEQMRTYVWRMLGGGVLNIEMKPEQVDQCIEDATQEFIEYNYGNGTILDYVIFQTSAGVSHYDVMNDPTLSAAFENVSQVIDIALTFGIDGINQLFSPTHILLQENYGGTGGYFSSRFMIGTSVPGLEMTSYKIAMMYLQDIREQFGKQYSVNWHPGRQVLVITPTPPESIPAVLTVYSKERDEYLYNDKLVKKLAIAKAQKLYGSILLKYEMNLPGGGTVSSYGQTLLQNGRDDEEAILAQIKGESEPIDFYIG